MRISVKILTRGLLQEISVQFFITSLNSEWENTSVLTDLGEGSDEPLIFI